MIPEAKEQTGQAEGPQMQVQKAGLKDKDADLWMEETPDSSIHRRRTKVKANPVPRHEEP